MLPGRYVGFGPLVSTVRSFKIVLANGDLVTASRDLRPDLFYGAIGGYGALGDLQFVADRAGRRDLPCYAVAGRAFD